MPNMTHRAVLTAWYVFAVVITATLSAVGHSQLVIAHSSHSSLALPKKFALVVGVSSYAAPALPELRYASADAQAMAAALEARGFAVEVLTERAATRANVTRALKDLTGHTNERDVALLYFSGHGLNRDGASYIALYDANPGRLDSSTLTLGEVYQLLGSRDRNRLVILDACETGAGAADNGYAIKTSVRTLFSSQPGNASYESDQLRHGVFTYYLLQGLRGEAANGNGIVTWNGLVNFAVRNVAAAAQFRAPLQIPHAVEAAGEDIVLGALDPTNSAARVVSLPSPNVNYLAQLPSRSLRSPADLQASLSSAPANSIPGGATTSDVVETRGPENLRPLASYSDLERQEMIRVWDYAVRTGNPAAYRLVCSTYPQTIYCLMARQEPYHGADEFREKGIPASPPPLEKSQNEEENVVRLKISTLVAALISILAILVTVVLWVLKFLADAKEKPKPLITLP
jgi:hypothetical protein